jgi:hypothetical protein
VAEHGRSLGRDTLVELYRSAHDLENDLAAIRMCTELALGTAAKDQVDPLLSAVWRDLEQVRVSTEEAAKKARQLALRLQGVLEEETSV